MGDNNNQKVQITIAVIGLLGVLATALISNWDKIFKGDTHPQTTAEKKTDSTKDTTATINFKKRDTQNTQNTQNNKSKEPDFSGSNFKEVLWEVMKSADQNFSSLKATQYNTDVSFRLYTTNVKLTAPYISRTSISVSESQGRFVFGLEGPVDHEEATFQKYNNDIIPLLQKTGFHVYDSQFVLGKSTDKSLQSVKYSWPKMEINFYRNIGRDNFHDEIVITHKDK
jgi:hypothetical protein